MRIFVEIPTWLGDAVMATPAIENIISQYSNINNLDITIFGSFVSTKLFLNHPKVTNIIIDDSKKSGFRYYNIYKLAKSAGHFDMAFSFRKNITSKILLFFLDTTKSFMYQRYDKSYGTHQVIRYNDFINKSLDINTTPLKLKIYTTPLDKKEVTKKTLGINPGATYGSAKRWYPTEFAKVAIALSKEYDIVIFGGPNETDIAFDIENELKNNGITNYQNLAGKTTIDELISYISNLDIFITNDSGPMHVSASFDIKTICIFGPTRHKETNQWKNPNEILIRKDFECSPCMKRVCPLNDVKTNHQCMKAIKAEDILAILK